MQYDIGDLVISNCTFEDSGVSKTCPAIIMAKLDDKYYGLKLSSYGKKENFDKYLKVIVLGHTCNLKDLSTVDFRTTVSFSDDDIRYKVSEVSTNKMNSIWKMLYFILKNLKWNKSIERDKLNEFKRIIDIYSFTPYYNIGDLLRYDNHYLLVVKRKDDKLLCYKVNTNNDIKYCFDTHSSKNYYIKYDELVSVDVKNIKKYALRSIMSKYFLNYIMATKYSYCNNNSKNTKTVLFNTNTELDYSSILINSTYNDSEYYEMNKTKFKIKNDIIRIKRKRIRK